jgi:hypothetical protein
MASLIERERTFQVVVYHDTRRYKLPGFAVGAVGKGLSEELGRNAEKLLQCKASGAIPPALRRYVEELPANIRVSMAKQAIIEGVAEGKLLVEHLEDYKAALAARAVTPGHITATGSMIAEAVKD